MLFALDEFKGAAGVNISIPWCGAPEVPKHVGDKLCIGCVWLSCVKNLLDTLNCF